MAYKDDPQILQLFHDVKNRLNNIAIATALLDEENISDDDKRKYTAEIRKNYTDIKLMMSDFLEV